MTIDTFSFRYADTAGFMEWFRYNPAQGLWIDRCDGAMQAKRGRMRSWQSWRKSSARIKLTNGMISASWIYVCAVATAGRFM